MKEAVALVTLALAGFAWSDSAPAPEPARPSCCRAPIEAGAADAPEALEPHAAQAAQTEIASSDIRQLMEGFGRAFRAIDDAVAASDLPRTKEAAQALARDAEGAGALEGIPAWFTRLEAARIGSFASELAAASGSEWADAARAAFEDLRRTCVACHAGIERAPEFPARGATLTGRVQVFTADGSLRETHGDVVVQLAASGAAATRAVPPPPARRHPAISQHGRSFSPKVLPVVRGTTVDFPNDDTVFHNVFSISDAARFDLGIYDPGKSVSVSFEKTGITPIYCNIHPEMRCTVIVVDTQFFALTEQDGTFVVTGLPEGDYVLRTWNEFGAISESPVTASPGRHALPAKDVHETRTVLSHLNKFGKPYSQKYK